MDVNPKQERSQSRKWAAVSFPKGLRPGTAGTLSGQGECMRMREEPQETPNQANGGVRGSAAEMHDPGS